MNIQQAIRRDIRNYGKACEECAADAVRLYAQGLEQSAAVRRRDAEEFSRRAFALSKALAGQSQEAK